MVTAVSLGTLNPEELHTEVLPLGTQRAWNYWQKKSPLDANQWYLAGGTALALQVGHRQSVDLDFFSTQTNFDETELERTLLSTEFWKTTLRRVGTLYGTFKGAKMSFIAYPFFRPSVPLQMCGKIHILRPADIAVMKIIAISQRGRRRDFVDLYWYCNNREPLGDILNRVPNHYPEQKHNLTHFLKSLTYFEDAEADPMPTLFFDVSWKKIKDYF